jgi:uncharacterized protein with FMN-binding domain
VRPLTAVAASVVGAGVLVAAWNAGERPAQISAAPVPDPSSTRPASPARGSATTSPSSPPSSRPSTGQPGTAPTSPATTNRQVNGTTVTTPYGPVQVKVDLSGSTITDVVALQLTNSNRTSERISASAAPLLREEALQAQSAQIDLVSGATYTSQGYQQSLQAALDAAHA